MTFWSEWYWFLEGKFLPVPPNLCFKTLTNHVLPSLIKILINSSRVCDLTNDYWHFGALNLTWIWGWGIRLHFSVLEAKFYRYKNFVKEESKRFDWFNFYSPQSRTEISKFGTTRSNFNYFKVYLTNLVNIEATVL